MGSEVETLGYTMGTGRVLLILSMALSMVKSEPWVTGYGRYAGNYGLYRGYGGYGGYHGHGYGTVGIYHGGYANAGHYVAANPGAIHIAKRSANPKPLYGYGGHGGYGLGYSLGYGLGYTGYGYNVYGGYPGYGTHGTYGTYGTVYYG